MVVLAITTDGTKVPVGLWDGDTENKTVVSDQLESAWASRGSVWISKRGWSDVRQSKADAA